MQAHELQIMSTRKPRPEANSCHDREPPSTIFRAAQTACVFLALALFRPCLLLVLLEFVFYLMCRIVIECEFLICCNVFGGCERQIRHVILEINTLGVKPTKERALPQAWYRTPRKLFADWDYRNGWVKHQTRDPNSAVTTIILEKPGPISYESSQGQLGRKFRNGPYHIQMRQHCMHFLGDLRPVPR